MQDLIWQANRHEEEWSKLLKRDIFLHNLQLGVAFAEIILTIPYLRPDVIKAARYLHSAFKAIRAQIKKSGEIKWWQCRRKRYCKFALKIAQLAGRLKQAAGSPIVAK